ncbi:IS3 family transposase [Salipiger aestuarii]|uniref:IS3 family transposase n=2 Tax=Salipiger aestuarii TaxID=568098 RepID=UPI0035CAAF0A
MVLDSEGRHGARWQAIASISAKIGCSAHRMNDRVKNPEVDSGRRAGIPSDMAKRMKAPEPPPIAPSTGHDRLATRAGPERLSRRVLREEPPRPEIRRVFAENWRGHGARKVWRQLRREGFDVARRTVARLMKDMGIQGLVRGKPHRATVPDKKVPCLRSRDANAPGR